MKTVSRVAGTAAVLLSLSLAACGGSQTVGAAPAAVATASPTPAAGSNSAARGTMQSTLTALQISDSSASPLAVLAARRAIRSVHNRSAKDTSSCSDNEEGSTTTDPTTGDTITTVTFYFDQACTEPQFSETLNFNTVNDNVLVATGSYSYYNTSGTVTQYDPVTLNVAVNTTADTVTLTLTGSNETAINGTPYGTFGTTCIVNEAAVSLNCGAAAVYTQTGSQSGVSMTQSYAINPDSETNANPIATISASAYIAASGLAVSAGTSPAWTVTGAAPVDTVAGTLTVYAIGQNANGTAGGTISLTDSATGIAVSGTISGNALTLTETLAGKQVASATVNQYGNGTITYADGTSKAIVGWTIQS